jgi:hypothetical protein
MGDEPLLRQHNCSGRRTMDGCEMTDARSGSSCTSHPSYGWCFCRCNCVACNVLRGPHVFKVMEPSGAGQRLHPPVALSSLTASYCLAASLTCLCACVPLCCVRFRRGLAHVAGFVLIVMGLGCEEEAFWVVTTLLEDKVFGYCNAQVRLCVWGGGRGYSCSCLGAACVRGQQQSRSPAASVR